MTYKLKKIGIVKMFEWENEMRKEKMEQARTNSKFKTSQTKLYCNSILGCKG